jgi:hypothetical protein
VTGPSSSTDGSVISAAEVAAFQTGQEPGRLDEASPLLVCTATRRAGQDGNPAAAAPARARDGLTTGTLRP